MNSQIKYVLTLSLFFISISAFTQTKYPNGGYLSFGELKAGAPSYPIEFEAERRDTTSIFFVGGNDYKMSTHVDSLKDENLKKKFYAISVHDTLFINCQKMSLQKWYSILHPDSGFYYFFAAECTDSWSPLYVEGGDNLASLFGAVGAGVNALKRRIYIIDMTTGVTAVLTNFYFERRCGKKHRDFFLQFDKDPNKRKPDVRLKYLRELNKLE